jgi:hypothetical protein
MADADQMIDAAVEREIAQLLTVDPSAEFAARIRVRAAGDHPSSWWSWWSTVLVSSAAVAAALALAITSSNWRGTPVLIAHPIDVSASLPAGGSAGRVTPGAADTSERRLAYRRLRLASVPSTTYTPIAAGGAGVNPLTSYQYKDIGTNIDCSTGSLDDGRFRLELSIEDSSVEELAGAASVDRPSFRSFRSTNSLVLKDGQSAQFTTAVDKLTGVVTKVDVTLTVVK